MGKKFKAMFLSIVLVLTMGISTVITFAEEGGGVYGCVEGDCCDCSSVLSDVIAEIIDQNRIKENVAYSNENFRDDVRMGIWKSVTNGTNYDYELAKLEMMLLAENYLEDGVEGDATISMWVKEGGSWKTKTVPWTKTNAIQGFINAYEEKYESTSDKSTSYTQAANFWENNIVNHLEFKTETLLDNNGHPYETVTNNTIADMLDKLGIPGMNGKSLEEMKEGVGHIHKLGDPDPCKCHHACSINQQTALQASVKHGTGVVPGYEHYVEVGISTDKAELTGLLSDKINVGVINIGSESDPFYIMAECVCRLGGTPVITPAVATPTWTPIDNGIQPEAVANVNANFKVDKKMKDVSFEFNIKELVEDTLGTNKIMDYDLYYDDPDDDSKDKNTVTVQVSKINGGTSTLIDASMYDVIVTDSDGGSPVVYDTVNIKFKETSPGTPYYFEENDEYRVDIYMRTSFKEGISYGPATGVTYNYKDNVLGNIKIVQVKLKGKVRVCEERKIGGITYPEAYNDTESEYSPIINGSSIPTNNNKPGVEVTYLEMAKVY